MKLGRLLVFGCWHCGSLRLSAGGQWYAKLADRPALKPYGRRPNGILLVNCAHYQGLRRNFNLDWNRFKPAELVIRAVRLLIMLHR
jgi:hypothetical protein